MRGKPSIESFLDGGNQETTRLAGGDGPIREAKADRRTKKLFELPESLVLEIERRCTDERANRGRRVTQREVVEALLQKWVRGEVNL